MFIYIYKKIKRKLYILICIILLDFNTLMDLKRNGLKYAYLLQHKDYDSFYFFVKYILEFKEIKWQDIIFEFFKKKSQLLIKLF